jgi:uridine kinase
MACTVVGIAGGTGSGKTTVARKIAASLPTAHVATLEYDSYYRDRSHMTPEERALLNFDHPDALETDLLVEHVRALREGRTVEVPAYDFVAHARRTETRRQEPTTVLIVEGILVFVDERLRDLMDIKLFVDTDTDVRVFRRIRRDIEQRGRTFDSVREQYYRTVRPMHLQFVEPSKRWADLVIPEGGNNEVALELVCARLRNLVDAAAVQGNEPVDGSSQRPTSSAPAP